MARPRKPTALKLLDGDQPCRINRSEPAAPKGAGPCPDWLDPVGRAAWLRVAHQLDTLGILTLADAEALALYASIYSRWTLARADLVSDGLTSVSETTVETSKGSTYRSVTKPHPMIAVCAECERSMARLLGQFGMTPSARSSLHVATTPEKDPILAFLEGTSKPRQGQA